MAGLGTMLILAAFSAATFCGETKNRDRSDEELKRDAREAATRKFTVPQDCKLTVETIWRVGTRRVVFDMPVPEKMWTMHSSPYVLFLAEETFARVPVWPKDKVTKDWPTPSQMQQYYLIRSPEKEYNPEKCLQRMALWFDANRDIGREINFEYARYMLAHREAGKMDIWPAVLAEELAKAKAPEARYDIYEHLATDQEEKQNFRKAIEYWLLAQKEMKEGDHPYTVTRRALPFLEAAKLYQKLDDVKNTEKYLKIMLETEYGKENPYETVKMLGALYESQEQFDEAMKVYAIILDESYGKRFANNSHVKSLLAPIRERVRIIGFRKQLPPLIEKMGNADPLIREQASKDIFALGWDVVPFLEQYENHDNAFVREGIKKLLSGE